MTAPDTFKIYKIQNALFDYECDKLIQLYEQHHMEWITDFYGFDLEYIDQRLSDITHDLTGEEYINQEPPYITKSTKDDPARIDAWTNDNPLCAQYGNRTFTVLFLLSDGFVTFPNINIQHTMKKGDSLIWNNITTDGRVIDSVNIVGPDTYYIKKWVREKPFV